MKITDDRITIAGLHGSPYTRKMVAVLRFWRMPYRLIGRREMREWGLPTASPPLMPTLYFPGADGVEPATDTTPLIRTLQPRVPDRLVVPVDPALAWVDALIEDYGDEWLTKAMFHYRWVYDDDIARSTSMLPLWVDTARPDAEIAEQGRIFAERQIGRLGVVGSNEATGPLIEESYRRLLDILDRLFTERRFILGNRPGTADFGILGQLTQLACFDPTPMALTLRHAPRVYAWTTVAEDLSGVEPEDDDWIDVDASSGVLRDLLAEIGRTYAPVMLANAAAVRKKEKSFEIDLDGRRWTQRAFPYQEKCLRSLRESFASLQKDDQSRVHRLIDGTGCERLVLHDRQLAVD